MVNASLNWASIVGIVLAVCGGGLYFLRSFKPALARDYDVFFAAIGLLCGGILFFQGWRLDPILQFGQFLLAGTTVFFAYESIRLRGVATDQARRSSYFDDDQAPSSFGDNDGLRNRWSNQSFDQLDDSQSVRRRFSGTDMVGDEPSEEDFYRPRRSSRAAIPEEAASRRGSNRNSRDSWSQDSEETRRISRFGRGQDESDQGANFGDRRSFRQDQRRGSRPIQSQQTSGRKRDFGSRGLDSSSRGERLGRNRRNLNDANPGIPQGSPMRSQAEDAAFSTAKEASRPVRSQKANTRKSDIDKQRDSSSRSGGSYSRSSPRSSRPRDNSSRFDD